MSIGTQKVVALAVLLVVGILCLPVTAYFLDDQGSASWIIPVTVVAMALVGAVVGRMLPGLAAPVPPRAGPKSWAPAPAWR